MSEVENIKVAVRCRPLSGAELASKNDSVVVISPTERTISLQRTTDSKPNLSRDFTFDCVFGADSTQQGVYESCVASIVDSVLSGYNATILAYGQTGTGKTYTMQGADGEEAGIMPRVFRHIFDRIEMEDEIEFLVRVSYLELYNEEIRDLLDKTQKCKLELKESKDRGVYVKNLRSVAVETLPDMDKVLKIGSKNRSVGETLMNKDSSRSHSIFSIIVETSTPDEVDSGKGNADRIRVGKLHLVDLAGSERQSKTGSTGNQLKEATNINLSLSALGNVISALVDRQGQGGHIPYRDSKLTRLLQDSLGGNTKTLMIANIGPADYNYEETLSTLRYANRAKNIKNKPRVNEDPKDALIREFQEKITSLKAQLETIEGSVQDSTEDVNTDKQVNHQSEVLPRDESTELHNEKLVTVENLTEANTCLQSNEDLIEQRKIDIEKATKEKRILQDKIREMERKLLNSEKHGGIVAVASLKERKLHKKLEKLSKREAKGLKKGARIAELEEASHEAQEKCLSLQEQIERLGLNLKKTMEKYKRVTNATEELYHDSLVEKRRLVEEIQTLHNQLELKELIMDCFIPERQQMKVVRNLSCKDEPKSNYQMLYCDKEESNELCKGVRRRPRSALGNKRPTSAFSAFASMVSDDNSRFKYENLLSLRVELPQE